MTDADEPADVVPIEPDPDVIGAYLRAGWTVDAAGRWHPPDGDEEEP
jgi:hypothetical protein